MIDDSESLKIFYRSEMLGKRLTGTQLLHVPLNFGLEALKFWEFMKCLYFDECKIFPSCWWYWASNTK